MGVTGRGSTHPGQAALLPARAYPGSGSPADPAVSEAAGSWVVSFCGEDGRQAAFRLSCLPLPGWHEALASALAERTGPKGGLRTLASAAGTWAVAKRLVRFAASLPAPPGRPGDLSAADLEAFLAHRSATIGEFQAWSEVRQAARLLAVLPPQHAVGQEVLDFARQRVEGLHAPVKAGYSDWELRQLVTAARADVAVLRDRIRAGQLLAARWHDQPDGLAGEARRDAGLLAGIAATGEVPVRAGLDRVSRWRDRLALAGRLFVTVPDLVPLMVLLVALTGRSPEMLKELPAEHRILGGLAAELRLVKRRRGPGRWHETVTWEIGQPGRELHHPGGLYLLLHQLMASGRALSGPASLWSTWSNGRAAGDREHHDPFAGSLTMPWKPVQAWAAHHALTTDDGQPLPVDLQRIKTSIEVRRTKQMGGHLPSAARTNTVPVLFRNYLRGDPTVGEWAQQVIGEALADAEQAALAAHRRAMQAAGGGPRVLHQPVSAREAGPPGAGTGPAAADGPSEGPWASCAAPGSHPATGKPCRTSFLDCFHCGNCLITRDHLPRLLALADALAARRQQLSEPEWWHRYGPAWAAIRHDILGRFSPAELSHAGQAGAADAMLDLVEQPWEMP